MSSDVLPAQYDLETGNWTPYHAENWKERPWLKNCGGCHVTGLNYEQRTFVEPAVGCEACHGPGSKHAAETNADKFAETITNPANLSVGLQVQVCGSCHTRGKDPSGKHGYPANFKPANVTGQPVQNRNTRRRQEKLLAQWAFKIPSPAVPGLAESTHAKEGVTCISCHTVHNTGAATRYQTRLPGDKLCLNCHTPRANPTLSHSLHDMNGCISCHMAKISSRAPSPVTCMIIPSWWFNLRIP